MGNPNTGEIYEGMLRDEGDVPLDAEQAAALRAMEQEERIAKLQKLKELIDRPSRSEVARPATFTSGNSVEMPRYKCHKEVWALKIKAIETIRPTVEELQRILDPENENPVFRAAVITPEETGYAPFDVDDQYMRKHNPQVGGYYVVYANGYQSFSPAKAFEEGYTRM